MRRVCVMALCAALVATTAWTTVLVPADLAELSRDARAIVRGRVASIDAQWTADRRGVETLVTLEVESYLKGSLGDSVTFRVPGGRLGRFRSVVVGAPEFVPDQRVIVFLGHRGPSVPYVIGFSQGVYRLVPSGTAWVVTPPVLAATTMAGPVVRGDPSRRPLPLEAFERRVRTLAGIAQ